MKNTRAKIKSLLLLVLPLTLFLPANVYAGGAQDFLNKIKRINHEIAIYAYELVPVAAVVISILYMSTALNPKNKDNAKIALYSLIVGTVLLFISTTVAWFIADLLGKDLNNLPFEVFKMGIIERVDGVTIVTKFEDKEKTSGTGEEMAYKGNTSGVIGNNPGDGKITSYAKKYLGVRYVLGGDSPLTGFDCSGFTKFVMRFFGAELPHSAIAQSTKGTFVSKDSLKEGDLVFFDTNGRGKVNHVGIYIGGGSFINAQSGAGKVMIAQLGDNYWGPKFITARRVLK